MQTHSSADTICMYCGHTSLSHIANCSNPCFNAHDNRLPAALSSLSDSSPCSCWSCQRRLELAQPDIIDLTQPDIIDLSEPDLIDLSEPDHIDLTHCDFCHFRGSSTCDCNPLPSNLLRNYHQSLHQTFICQTFLRNNQTFICQTVLRN